jgi:hypothetical protein
MRSRASRRATFLNDTCPQDSSPFFSLPWELRSYIYSFAFGDRVYVSFGPENPSRYRAGEPGQYILHDTCSNSDRNGFGNGLARVGTPRSPFSCWTWPSLHVTHELAVKIRCGYNLRGCVRVLRTCQRIYFEGRSIFFASMLFDFGAVLFRDFYNRFLRPQPHGFNPANHVKYLVLRRPEMRSDTPGSQWKRSFLENLNLWRDTLALLRSSRWNLAWLFVEDFDLICSTKANSQMSHIQTLSASYARSGA